MKKNEKARLEVFYKEKIVPALFQELQLANIMQVPKVSKIVLNIGVKDAVTDNKILQNVQNVLSVIAGQASVKTFAKKSIAGFKIREGMALGVKVTLRKKRMYEFLDQLINVALPMVRDFRGVPTKLDRQGNYNLGIKEWVIFPGVDYDTLNKVLGLNITIETSTKNDKQAFALLKHFGMPFVRDNK